MSHSPQAVILRTAESSNLGICWKLTSRLRKTVPIKGQKSKLLNSEHAKDDVSSTDYSILNEPTACSYE